MDSALGGPGIDVSVIGAEARITGTFESTGSLRIDGQLKGKLSIQGEVVLSKGSVVEADIRADGITLGGHVKGTLTAPGDVSLPPESRVEGDVHARSVTTHGFVLGNILAEEKVELGAGARVEGDITCRILVVAERAVFCGRSIMGEQAESEQQTATLGGAAHSP